MRTGSGTVVIAPWASIEADCLRDLIAGAGIRATCQPDDTSRAYVLTVPRKLTPFPLDLPACVEQRMLPVLLVVDAVEPWSMVLGRSVGATGLVSWDRGAADLVAEICRVMVAGARIVPAPRGPSTPEDPLTRLTLREREIMALVTRGEQDGEIAARLGISVHTVRSHIRHCLTKLDVTHRHAAATLVRRGLQSVPVPTPLRMLTTAEEEAG